MKSTLFILLCALALNACGDRDPVSSGQPGENTGTTGKRVSSTLIFSAPVAGLSEIPTGTEAGMDTTEAGTDSGDSDSDSGDSETDTTDSMTDSTDVSVTNPGTEEPGGTEPALPGTVVFSATPGSTEEWGTDDFDLDDAVVSGDTLSVTVSYGGGCEDHVFTLVASEAFQESDPVQLAVTLAHEANDDACERWVTQGYSFDLLPIKERFQNQYQDSGTIVLQLEDAPGELLYEFEE